MIKLSWVIKESGFYGWSRKVISWEVIYYWWRCHEGCWTQRIIKYFTNLVDKAAVEFGRIDSNFESTVGKMLSSNITYYKEIICERKSPLMQQNLLLSYLRNNSHPLPSATTTWRTRQPKYQGKTLHQQKDYNSLKAQMMVRNF